MAKFTPEQQKSVDELQALRLAKEEQRRGVVRESLKDIGETTLEKIVDQYRGPRNDSVIGRLLINDVYYQEAAGKLEPFARGVLDEIISILEEAGIQPGVTNGPDELFEYKSMLEREGRIQDRNVLCLQRASVQDDIEKAIDAYVDLQSYLLDK